MKHVLLTSAGMQIQEEIIKLLPKPAKQTRIAHITTAARVQADTQYVARETQIMDTLGFQITDIDITGKDEARLIELLEDQDVIYVQGGDTFYLLQQTRLSGFDNVVRNLVEQGKIYIGVSAGSYLACPTIEPATWKHPERNHYGLMDLSGLNLVPFLVSVHYQPEYKNVLQYHIQNTNYPVKILSDDQGLLVRDETITLIGNKMEIQL